jgi:hypothetical protein
MAQQRQQCPKSRDRARYSLVRFTRTDGSWHLFVDDGADRSPQDPSCDNRYYGFKDGPREQLCETARRWLDEIDAPSFS